MWTFRFVLQGSVYVHMFPNKTNGWVCDTTKWKGRGRWIRGLYVCNKQVIGGQINFIDLPASISFEIVSWKCLPWTTRVRKRHRIRVREYVLHIHQKHKTTFLNIELVSGGLGYKENKASGFDLFPMVVVDCHGGNTGSCSRVAEGSLWQ